MTVGVTERRVGNSFLPNLGARDLAQLFQCGWMVCQEDSPFPRNTVLQATRALGTETPWGIRKTRLPAGRLTTLPPGALCTRLDPCFHLLNPLSIWAGPRVEMQGTARGPCPQPSPHARHSETPRCPGGPSPCAGMRGSLCHPHAVAEHWQDAPGVASGPKEPQPCLQRGLAWGLARAREER